jgi:two-component system response regulator FixJ
MAKAKLKAAQTPIEAILGISSAKATDLMNSLTEREQQVADLMATGKKNRGIADELGISSKTLDIHRTNVKRKLSGKTAIDVARVVFAQKFGEHLK